MKRAEKTVRWKRSAIFLLPSLLLVPIFVFYLLYGGTSHFFLHTLMGWNVALLLLLTLTACGFSCSRWDGVAPLALAFYAMTPDFIYALGPFHRDWMDVFLFHVALDEMLPIALPVLIFLWGVLLVSYICFRLFW